LLKDDLYEVLEKVEKADALILGSPIYFGEITGEMWSLMERFFFQYHVYDKKRSVLLSKKMKTGFFFTMNAPERAFKENEYEQKFRGYESIMKHFLDVENFGCHGYGAV